jgi:hypothetical protein
MNRPVATLVSQPRSASRLALDRTPSIFAGTISSPSRSATSPAEIPSLSPAARTRAAASRSSNSPITDVTGHLRIAEPEPNVRTLHRRRRDHA